VEPRFVRPYARPWSSVHNFVRGRRQAGPHRRSSSPPLTSPLRLVPQSSAATPGVGQIATWSPHVMRRAWREMALSPLPLDGAVSRAALWVSDGQLRRNGVAGVTVPGGFSFARTRGLLRVTPPKRRPALEWSPRTGSEDSGAPLTAAGQTPEPQSTRRGVRRSSTPATIGRRPGASASAQSKRASRRSECSGGHGVSRQPFR